MCSAPAMSRSAMSSSQQTAARRLSTRSATATAATSTVDHVYQHGNTDALCWCGNANLSDNYSTIHLAISNDHLENTYTDGHTDTMNHNTFINTAVPDREHLRQHEQWQRRHLFRITLTVTNNLLAGGGYTIYPCGNASSAGSSSLDIRRKPDRALRSRRRGRAGRHLAGRRVVPIRRHRPNGLFPRGGSFGNSHMTTVGRRAGSKNNIWDDDGSASTC